MSENMLHIFAPTRFDNVGAIVGDQMALLHLRNAISDAIDSGTGGAYVLQSDGEGYSLAILLAGDMLRVSPTSTADMPTRRAARQTVGMRALPRFLEAIQKSRSPLAAALEIPRFIPRRSGKASF